MSDQPGKTPDSANPTPRKRGGLLKTVLIILLLPFALFGGYEALPFVSGIRKEVNAVGGWKNMYEELRNEWETEGFEGVQQLLEDAPEMKIGVLLRKAVINDPDLKKQVTAAVVRLKSEEKLTAGEARALVQLLGDEAA